MELQRVLLADDHTIVRAGMKFIVQELLPSAVFHEAFNGDQVVAFVKKHPYELIVLDINMPETDSIGLVTNVFAYREESKVLIYSMNSEDLYAKRFLQLGVLGYLNKESDSDEIKKAVASVLKGEVYVSKKLRKALSDQRQSQKTGENPFEQLSDREIQTVKYLLHGYSLLEIRKILNVHSSTVGTYKTRIFEKLKVKTIRDLGELAKLYHLEISKF